MGKKTLFRIFTVLIILSFLVSPVKGSVQAKEEPPQTRVVTGPVATTGTNPGTIASLSGTNVTFTTDGAGDDAFIPGVEGTFYFVAHSYTTDWEYVYNVWLQFPADWIVSNVELVGTPVCTGGGTWGTLSWSYETSPYAVNIYHPRYQVTTDDCTATYAVTATPAVGVDALVSWYWDGDGYGSPPHNPCSIDGYTPPSMSGQPCDESVNDQAVIPGMPLDPGLYLFPDTQTQSGCNGVPTEYTVQLFNNTAADGTFDLDYSVPTANGTLSGPSTLFAADGAVVPFVVTLEPDLCAIGGDTVVGQVDAEGNTYSASSLVNKIIAAEPGWSTIPGSAPSWAGFGYVSDGCTAMVGPDPVTFVIGDVSGTGPVGFWGYNHNTNSWYQPAAANIPVDRWAPDWAYDEDTNLCYLTGGGSAPGPGNYNDAYIYNPGTNAFTALPSFTSVRDFHDSWVGFVDGTKYMCIGGGNNGAGLTSTQCLDIATGTWAAENATLGAMPVDTWGAADGVLHDAGGDLFVSIAGAQSGSMISDAAWYWDDADNLWHSAGNTGLARYRVEGDFVDGVFYQVAGSDGTFTGTTGVRVGTWNGSTWSWDASMDVTNRRLDNVANTVNGTLWSIDGYGSNASDYVEHLAFCPLCDLQGWLEGNVYDGDTQPLVKQNEIDSLTGSFVEFDPDAGGDTCYTSGVPGTYCFEAYSNSPDYAYAYNVWLKFPADWTVTDAYVQGTPTCNNGSFGTFSWSFETSPYEVNIYHPRYMGSGGAECWATYCVAATPGAGGDDALESWYWAGDDYGAAPKHPCSSDNYTPASQTDLCDEAVLPQAAVPTCGTSDLNPPCTQATVTINPGDITVPVDPATGHYGPVMLIQGDYTVEASAPGFSTDTADVTIVDEVTTTQDFTLFRPVIAVDPLSFDVSAAPGVPVYETLDISNLGSLPLEWSIYDFGAGAKGSAAPSTRVEVPAVAGQKIDADLATELAGGSADFFVWMAEKADLSGAANLQTKEEKGQYVFDALTAVADRTQRDLRAHLDQQGIEYKAYYIANKILVQGGSAALALDLAGRPDVYRLSANHEYQLDVPVMDPASASPDAVEGNIDFINAPDVWAMGFTGEGIVLAGNDTGLDETHPAIAPHYRGCLNPPTCSSWDHNYNWWDATGTYPNDPWDGFGHGTHTTGTMVGDDGVGNQIGVAPGAQTVHCKNMTDGGSGDDGTFTECFQWDLAPWDLTGANPMVSMAPDAINNSWGYGGGGAPQFEDEILALQAAGILVEVSAGNEGPGCSTLRSPGDYEYVLTTGSVDDEGQTFPGIITMGGWSPSRGPSSLYPGAYFPDIMAPGQNVRSALPGNSWGSWGGTSMAGPHATGLIGLIWSAVPALRGQVADTIDIIRQSAGPLVGQPGSNCGGDYTVGPNNDWGYGTIDALAAVELAQQSADLPWLTEDPTSGIIDPGATETVDLTFLCTPEQEGFILQGTLRIDHNDPCSCPGGTCDQPFAPIDIPVTFTCGAPLPPDINVVPDTLSSTQDPDTIVTQQIDIQNLGSTDLDWNIVEEAPPLGRLVDSLRPVVAPATTLFDFAQAKPGVDPTIHFTPPVIPNDVLVDQAPNAVNGIFVDSSCAACGTGQQSVADNFIIDADTSLTQVIFWSGYFPNDTEITPDTIRVRIMQDAAGFPGTVIYDESDVAYERVQTGVILFGVHEWMHTLTLAAQVPLPAGTYWIEIFNNTGGDDDDFFWETGVQDPTHGIADSLFAVETPGVTWAANGGYDMSMQLIGGAPVPGCTPSNIPWITVNPTSGTTPGHEGFLVDVTFDSTGMAPGTYTADLCIASNDPVDPNILVPLEMVVNQILMPDIDVTPLELSATLPPDDTETQQLDICNVGDAILDWDMSEISPTLAGQPIELKIDSSPTKATLAPVELILDDGSRDNDIGLGGTIEMLWVNRFTPAPDQFPFQLNQVQIYFSALGMVNVGDDIIIIVYENTTGGDDPAVGSNFLAAFPTTIQALDTWNVYDLPTPIAFNGPGDVIIGAIGLETPGTSYWPASMDQTATQARSWAGWWNASPPPNPPLLPPDNWTLIDVYFPGNWMVRGYGETVSPVDFLWLSEDPTTGSTTPESCTTVDVTFDSTGLLPDVYNAALSIASNDPDEPTIVVPVQLTVTGVQPEPIIVVAPLAITETLEMTDTIDVELFITNDGTADLVVDGLDIPASWLTTTFTGATILPGDTFTVTLTLDSAGLDDGTYHTTLTVLSNAGDVDVEVTLIVLPPQPPTVYPMYLPVIVVKP